jgi:hypothetical protein
LEYAISYTLMENRETFSLLKIFEEEEEEEEMRHQKQH